MTCNIKIVSHEGFIGKAIYLGDNLSFKFQTQTSAPPLEYTLTNGTIIEFDSAATRKQNLVGELKVEGVFFNFYKSNPVLLTLCATNIYETISTVTT